MILAAWDYWQYRQRLGRYSDVQHDAAMGAFAFVDQIPKSQVEQFKIGDFIFTQRLNSILSWAMMYITSSSVDHAAIYAGDGRVAHRTLHGAGYHSLRAFAKGSRLVVVRMAPSQLARWSHEFEIQRGQIDTGPKFMRHLTPKMQLAIGGLMAIHGRYHDRFRWKLWLEFFLTLLSFSWIINHFTQMITVYFAPICSVYFLVHYKAANFVHALRKKPPLIMSHPDVGYYIFFKVGGLMFTRMYPIVISDLGLLPLKVILGLAGKGADDGADDELKEAREFFRNLIEGWNISEFPEQTKDHNSDQNQYK